MSYREVRGSYHSAARDNETQSGLPSSETRYVGFRLVHDNVDQVCRGGSGNYDPPFARGAARYGNSPGFRGVFLGFRLVWDRT